MGHIEDYDTFLDELDKVWGECFRVLVPGGRVVCVVGDVCISRRRGGRHTSSRCPQTFKSEGAMWASTY